MNNRIERIGISIFFSSLVCLILYLATALVLQVNNGIDLNSESIGIVVIIWYFVIPFIAIYNFKGE